MTLSLTSLVTRFLSPLGTPLTSPRWTLLALPLTFVVAACDMPSPQSPAEPIGEYPVWGKGFGEQAAQPAGEDSLFAGGGAKEEGPAPSEAPNAAAESGGGGSATPNMPSPFANEDWGGGDAAYGKQVFTNQCARCHGMEGKGGMMPGVGMVPTLRDPNWHARMSDKQLASTIAHGKGAMPSFMQLLDGKELRGVIAYLRTLKASEQTDE